SSDCIVYSGLRDSLLMELRQPVGTAAGARDRATRTPRPPTRPAGSRHHPYGSRSPSHTNREHCAEETSPSPRTSRLDGRPVFAGELHTLKRSVRATANPILQSLDAAMIRRDGSSSVISNGSRSSATCRDSRGRGPRRGYPWIVGPQAVKSNVSSTAKARCRIPPGGKMQDGLHA